MAGKASKPDDADNRSGAKPALDWAETYWELQREYPGHARFTGKAFGRCPAYIVESALKAAQQARLNRLRDGSRVTAKVGYLLLLAQGVKQISLEQINDWDFIEQVMIAKAAIPKSVAIAWLEAEKRGCMPSWAMSQVNHGMIEKAAL